MQMHVLACVWIYGMYEVKLKPSYTIWQRHIETAQQRHTSWQRQIETAHLAAANITQRGYTIFIIV